MKIIIKNLQKKIPISQKRLKQAVARVLSLLSFKKDGEINICFVSDDEITELNLLYLGENNPTDVIAFDNSLNKKETLADIAISTDSAIRNAGIYKTTPLYEIYLYIIHGILHILGYGDETERQKQIMRRKEQEILKALHVNSQD